MRTVDLPLTAMLLLAATAGVVTEQRSTAPATATAPRLAFTVVSVRRNMTNDVGSNIMDRADGGFTMLNVPVSALIARAYSPAVPLDMVGLPRWATTDRYDVSTTSSIANPTADQRRDMAHIVRRLVDEDPDGRHERRQRRGNRAGPIRIDTTRTTRPEHDPQRARTALDGRRRIFSARDAANLHHQATPRRLIFL